MPRPYPAQTGTKSASIHPAAAAPLTEFERRLAPRRRTAMTPNAPQTAKAPRQPERPTAYRPRKPFRFTDWAAL